MKYRNLIIGLYVILTIACNSNSKLNSDNIKDSIAVDTLESGFVDTASVDTVSLEEQDLNSDLTNINLNKIKEKNKLFFGDLCGENCAYIEVEFIGSNQAKLKNYYVFEINGNSGHFKKDPSFGTYQVEYLSQNEIVTDNYEWPVHDSIIVLTNMNYGYDNGHLRLSKKYAIAKCKSGNLIQEPSIYEWLDPINYPSRNSEYSWTGSKRLTKIE